MGSPSLKQVLDSPFFIPLIQGGGPAQLVRAEVRAPERRPPRGDHGLRAALGGARQGRLRPRRGQEVPHPRLQRRDQVCTRVTDWDWEGLCQIA